MSLNKLKAKLINKAFYMLNHTFSFCMDRIPFFLQTPFVLHIRVTTKCNLKCSFCYLKEGLNQEEHDLLTIEEWEKILSKLPRTTIIDITGAEPFLAKDFDKLLMLIKRLGFKCSVTTNGTVFNEKIIETIMESSIEYILISLDGMEKIHNELRGNPRAFSKSLEFINIIQERAKKHKKKLLINVKTMLIDENLQDIIPLIEYTDTNIKPDIITINLPFQNEARGGRIFKMNFESEELQRGNTFKFSSPDKAIAKVQEVTKVQKKIKTPVIFKPGLKENLLRRYIFNPSDLTANKCQLYKNNLTLYYDGSITPCDISVKVDNIRDLNYKLREIYTSPNFLSFKKTMSSYNKVCEGCVFSRQVLKE